jgi:hypothetical protein
MTNEVSWKEVLALLSPAGQQQLIEFVRQAKADRGKNWLPEIQQEFPLFSWIVDLVCNKSAEEAFAELQTQFPAFPLQIVRPKLQNLHATLRTEIERKR